MAVVRARSAPPYGAFVGFFLFGVAALAAVACYVMYAGAVDEKNKAVKLSESAGTLSDVTAFKSAFPGDGGTGASSPALRLANQKLADLNKQLSEAVSKRDDLQNQVNSLQGASKDFQSQSTNAQGAAKQSSTDLLNAREGFAKATADMNAQITKLNGDIAKANEERNAAISKAQDDLAKAQAQFEERARDRVLELEQLKSENARKDAEIAEFRNRLRIQGGPKDVATVGEADGTVASVNQAAGEVSIFLGKKDRIVPGMTFTCYDPRTGVRFGTDEAAQGNGSIEVMEVNESSSICRITRTSPNHIIQAGDFIANIVYHTDRNRQFRFVVRGDFDLDGDGIATAAERDRVIRLITNWGGKVDDRVTSQTDYVIIGTKPSSVAAIVEAPAEGAAASMPAAEPGSIADQRAKEQQGYDDAIQQATRLSIPVLNANRFLALVGYYNTTIVRYGAAAQ